MDSTNTKSTITNDNFPLTYYEDDGFLEDVDQSKINRSGGCNQSKKVSENDSTNGFSNIPDIDDDRGDSDGDEVNLLEREIEEKKLVLKRKRHELCDRLMSYKLMQFSASSDASNIHALSAKQSSSETEFKAPSQADKLVDSESPASFDLLTGPQVSTFFNEHEIPYGLSEESLVAMAIQASIDDMAKTQAAAKQSPSLNEGASGSGYSDNPETKSENRSCIPAAQNIEGSSQSSSKPFTAPNPLLRWNTLPDTDTQNQSQEAVEIKETDNLVQEDFIESERYVGDKGKRPLSGKYSYKKRSKVCQADSNEQPSGSNLAKDESLVSDIVVD